MKKILVLLLLSAAILAASCEKEETTFAIKNDWTYSATDIYVTDGGVTTKLHEICPDSVSQTFEAKGGTVTVRYYITEGLILDTFDLDEGHNILILDDIRE